MKTFYNQTNKDQYLTLPLEESFEVIGRMKNNPKCVIHLITPFKEGGVIKQRIKYHYK